MEVIKENMKACGKDEDMVKNRKWWRVKIRVTNPTYMEIKAKII